MWIALLKICVLIAVVRGEYLYNANPYSHYGEYAAAYDNYKPTDYKFEYGVSDPHTGDHKSQWEVKENGVVRGAYSLLEPDGTTRIVEYYADDTGFHADVKKIGTAFHDVPHYGTLHSIADAHIVDSLAYNGYGHGGVAQAYGAPIAAVAKVATPIPELVHTAPIAQIQHIEPIPQVIAPQIHHVGSPYDVHFPSAPAPHLFNPAPFQLPSSSITKSYETPILAKSYETPIVQYQDPAYGSAISKTYAGPILSKSYDGQVISNVAPFAAKDYAGPIITKEYQTPIIADQAPIITKDYGASYGSAHQVPIVANTYQAPIVAHSAPVLLKNKYDAPILAKSYVPEPSIVSGGYQAPPPVIKLQNPLTRLLAPLAKYFVAPAAAPKIIAPAPKVISAPLGPATKVISQPTYYAEAPSKVFTADYDAYDGYKPEVVFSAPHNYPAYDY